MAAYKTRRSQVQTTSPRTRYERDHSIAQHMRPRQERSVILSEHADRDPYQLSSAAQSCVSTLNVSVAS